VETRRAGKNGEWRIANGEWKETANSEWRMANGKDGEQRVASGVQRMKTANGEWMERRIANGEWWGFVGRSAAAPLAGAQTDLLVGKG
jgi:hypothetical protein